MSVPTRMPFYRTTVGKKVVMALTGIVMLLFIMVHMAGNLQLFSGPACLDGYAALLKANPFVLWGFRTVLLGTVLLHVLTATLLTLQSWAGRPIGYVREKHLATDLAARSMRWGGVAIAIFVVIHLLQLTTGDAYPRGAGMFSTTNVHANLVGAFSLWWVAAFYFVAMAVLALHVLHGSWSVLQTLGANHPVINRWRRVFAALLMAVVIGGFLAIPASILAGWVR